jgi:PAS domain S-box-containing protein
VTGENSEGEVERGMAKNLEAESALRESEEKYRILFESVPVGIGISDFDGKVIAGNRAMLELTGYAIGELMTINIADTYANPDERKRLFDALQEYGRARDWEVKLKRKDGTVYHALLNIDVAEIGGKKLFITSQRDITERKKAEEELRKYHEHLEEVVEKRTAELEVLNEQLQRDIAERRKIEEKLQEERNKLQSLVDAMEYGLTIHDRDYNIIYKNKVLRNIFGEHIGEKCYRVYEGKDKVCDGCPLRMTYEDGESHTSERKVVMPSGEVTSWENTANPIRDASGAIVAGLEIARDITERRRAEDALKESEEMYKTLVRTSPDAVVVVDLKEGITEVSQRALQLYGFENAEEILGRKAYEFIALEDRERSRNNFQETLKRELVVRNREYIFLRKDKTHFIGELNAAPIKDAYGRPKAFIITIRDITERRRAEDEMRKRLMKFKLEDGKLYLVKEPVSSLSLDALKDFLGIGYHGLVISRTPELERVVGEGCDFLWVSEKGGEKSLSPKIEEIELKIGNLQRRNVVLLDRLDYIIFKNGFKKTLSFVQRLRELTYLTGLTVILSVDPSALSMRELNLLEKEALEVEPLHKVKMPEHLLEVLRFIYRQNYVGVKPSYTDVGAELEISKPTVRKRIRLLISAGYVSEVKKGRDKIVELTEGGRRFFLK